MVWIRKRKKITWYPCWNTACISSGMKAFSLSHVSISKANETFRRMETPSLSRRKLNSGWFPRVTFVLKTINTPNPKEADPIKAASLEMAQNSTCSF